MGRETMWQRVLGGNDDEADVYRLPVPNGWLYQVGGNAGPVAFVPDPGQLGTEVGPQREHKHANADDVDEFGLTAADYLATSDPDDGGEAGRGPRACTECLLPIDQRETHVVISGRAWCERCTVEQLHDPVFQQLLARGEPDRPQCDLCDDPLPADALMLCHDCAERETGIDCRTDARPAVRDDLAELVQDAVSADREELVTSGPWWDQLSPETRSPRP